MEDITLVDCDNKPLKTEGRPEVSRKLRQKEWSSARLKGGKALSGNRVFGEQLQPQDQMNKWENTDEDG